MNIDDRHFEYFAKPFLEEYAIKNIPSSYDVEQWEDRILIRKRGSPKKKNILLDKVYSVVYWDLGIILELE